MRILLLSAYAAHSHCHWQRTLELMFPGWDWVVLSLPPRHFSWRVRGNPLYWSIEKRSVLEQDYDLLLATSMVDLATLRGLVPDLARLPTALYFHENQFAYPRGKGQKSLLEAQMVSLYSALAADKLLFNSDYNRRTFLAGCQALLDKLPDFTPAVTVPGLAEKSAVLPVPVIPNRAVEQLASWPGTQGEYPRRPVRLLWSGRFEYDKGGEGLYMLLRLLVERGLHFELAVTGQQFRNSPREFEMIRAEFNRQLIHFGFVESVVDYRALQAGADFVLSTALHEFQGLSVMDAVMAGCLPLVPDRLAYPEIYPQQFRYPSVPDELSAEVAGAADILFDLCKRLAGDRITPPDLSAWRDDQLLFAYREIFQALAG